MWPAPAFSILCLSLSRFRFLPNAGTLSPKHQNQVYLFAFAVERTQKFKYLKELKFDFILHVATTDGK